MVRRKKDAAVAIRWNNKSDKSLAKTDKTREIVEVV